MKARAEVDPGICGFHTTVVAESEDGQHVTFEIATDCDKVRLLAQTIKSSEPLDAFQEISPRAEGEMVKAMRACQKGGCSACATSVAIFKTMQVAAGVALPKDISVTVRREDE